MARRTMPAWQSAPLRVLLAVVGLAATLSPRPLERVLAPLLGRLLLALDWKRWRVADENLRRCFPDMDAGERWALIKKNYAHYGFLVFELAHAFSPVPGHYRRFAERIAVLEGFEHWKRAHDLGKGVLFASSHVGNWEMMAAMGGLHGIPLTIVTRRLTPEWLLKKMESARLSVNVRAAYQPRTLPTILRALRGGESVGFVIDQYAPPPMGLKVRFFGVEVDTLAAVGPLAQRIGAPIVPVSTHRDERGIIHVRIEPALELGEDSADQTKVTQVLADKVESWIRAHPAQWLWVHRRFKNI